MDDWSTAIQQLLDREEIRDLPKRYCDYVWQDNALGVSGLFSENGSFTAKIGEKTVSVEGREKIASFMQQGLADSPRPFIHNHVIELDSAETAHGRAYLDLRSGKHNFDWLGAGYYEDKYVKEDGRWLFKARVFYALRIDDWPGEIDKM